MDVKTAIKVLRKEGERRHAILCEQLSVIAKANDYARNDAETKAVCSRIARTHTALRSLAMFEGEI
jgi:hypothetical protein